MTLVRRLYARRLVNINVNVILAGVLTLALTVATIHLTRYVGLHDKRWLIAIKIGADIIFDVAIYYALHWVANHHLRPAPPKAPTGEAPPKRLAFFRDATLVQFERALLAPIYYGVMGLVVWMVLDPQGANREAAVVLGFACGMLATRVIHTLWLILSGRN